MEPNFPTSVNLNRLREIQESNNLNLDHLHYLATQFRFKINTQTYHHIKNKGKFFFFLFSFFLFLMTDLSNNCVKVKGGLVIILPLGKLVLWIEYSHYLVPSKFSSIQTSSSLGCAVNVCILQKHLVYRTCLETIRLSRIT